MCKLNPEFVTSLSTPFKNVLLRPVARRRPRSLASNIIWASTRETLTLLLANNKGFDARNPDFVTCEQQRLRREKPDFVTYEQQRLRREKPDFVTHEQQRLRREKPDFVTCEQPRRRPACACAQSDQQRLCFHYLKSNVTTALTARSDSDSMFCL